MINLVQKPKHVAVYRDLFTGEVLSNESHKHSWFHVKVKYANSKSTKYKHAIAHVCFVRNCSRDLLRHDQHVFKTDIAFFSCSSFVSTPLIPHRQYLTQDHSRAKVQNPYFIWQLSFVTYRRYYAQRVGDRWSKICLLYVRRQEVNNIQLSDKMITLYTVSVEQILFLNVAWKYSYSVTGNIAQHSCNKYLNIMPKQNHK
jgi:sRNA-binding regulator protein Hfq